LERPVPRLNLARTLRRVSKLLLATTLVVAWFAPSLQAETTSGVSYQTFWSNGGSPTLPAEGQQPISSGQAQNIDFSWGSGEILGSGRSDGVIIRFDGWIRPDEPGIVSLCGLADDGFLLYLDGALQINDWFDKGTSCGNVATVDFSDDIPKQMTAWFYENGGFAAVSLLYWADTTGVWATVPETWYSSDPATTTTTTTTSTSTTSTTIEETTTTEPETTTTTEPEPETTTSTEPEATTTTFVEETTTTISEPETTTTMVEESWPTTTESTNPPTTITTIAPAPIAPVIPAPTPTTALQTSSTAPETTSPPQESSTPPSSVSSTTLENETAPPESSSPLPDTQSPTEAPPATDDPVAPSTPTVSNDGNLGPSPVTTAQSTATSSTTTTSTEPPTSKPTAPPADATEEQKQEFEETVNVFDGTFDDYVPSGSNVTVAERRTIIAVTTTVTLLAPVATQRRRG
jgi:hypothetical protein